MERCECTICQKWFDFDNSVPIAVRKAEMRRAGLPEGCACFRNHYCNACFPNRLDRVEERSVGCSSCHTRYDRTYREALVFFGTDEGWTTCPKCRARGVRG